jgi:hypothetical protein
MSEKYIVDSISTKHLTDKKIKIPTFQRGIVWNDKKKKGFIKNVLNGEPFGIVLLYLDEKDNKYWVIDGLQRLSTLKGFIADPFKLIDEEVLFDTEDHILIDIVNSNLNNEYKTNNSREYVEIEVQRIKKSIVKNVSDFKLSNAADVWEKIANEIGYSTDITLVKKYNKLHNIIEKRLKLPNDLKIPAIIYIGDKNNLPNVFFNLNTGSVKLTKYEIHASTWNQDRIKIEDEDIIKHVIKKYKDVEKDSDFEVEFDESDIQKDGITFFEYCYALSEIIYDKENGFENLFGDKTKGTEAAGFDLLSIISGLDVNQSGMLIEKLGKKDPKFLTELKNKIIDVLETTSKSLKKFTYDFNERLISNDSLYQVYHIIFSYFSIKYDINFQAQTIYEKQNTSSKLKNFTKNLPYRYLLDILNSKWAKNRQVSDLTRLLINEEEIQSYTNAISPDELSRSLYLYLDEVKVKANTNTINESYKLILNFYFKLTIDKNFNLIKYFKSKEDDIYDFDFEHIIPKQKFKEKNLSKFLPVSSLGNITYLPIVLNRGKRDKTIYEYSDSRPGFALDKDFLELTEYPAKDEIDFINFQNSSFSEKFKKFIDERENRLIQKIIKLYKDQL